MAVSSMLAKRVGSSNNGIKTIAPTNDIHERTRMRNAVIVFVIVAWMVLLFYVGSYLYLSSRGRYEPAVIALNGVKAYAWAPQGFVEDFQWNATLVRAYLPLYLLDRRLWHKQGYADSDRYPTNKIVW